MTCPLVSVVIPAYNSESSIADCINSALNQTHANIEVVVVDDCSTDRTLEVVEQFANVVKLVASEVNRGGSAARNNGADVASGEYIAFLDADDILFPMRVEEQLLAMLNAKADFSYCFGQDEDGSVLGKAHQSDLFRELVTGAADIVSSSGLMISKALHRAIAGFDECFSRHQDIEYAIRAYRESSNCVVIEKPLFLKQHSGSPSFGSTRDGIRHFWSKFSTSLNTLSVGDLRIVYGRGYRRFFELSLREKRMVSVWYFLIVVFVAPDLLLSKLSHYWRRVR